jgi:hypothetical protein
MNWDATLMFAEATLKSGRSEGSPGRPRLAVYVGKSSDV